LPTEKPGAERRRVFYGIMRSSLQYYSIKNPHIAQRFRVSLMPPPVRIGEANPVLPTGAPGATWHRVFFMRLAYSAAYLSGFNFL